LTNSFDHFRCPQICRQSGALFLPQAQHSHVDYVQGYRLESPQPNSTAVTPNGTLVPLPDYL
jgi:hypothetical protein